MMVVMMNSFRINGLPGRFSKNILERHAATVTAVHTLVWWCWNGITIEIKFNIILNCLIWILIILKKIKFCKDEYSPCCKGHSDEMVIYFKVLRQKCPWFTQKALACLLSWFTQRALALLIAPLLCYNTLSVSGQSSQQPFKC